MAKSGVGAVASKCSVCGENFLNIQDCLKHELIQHSLKKKSVPDNRLQKKLNGTAKVLNADEKLMERDRLKNQLQKCKNGHELRTIFELFCMKTDNLDLIFTRIQTCLEKELKTAGILRIYPFGSIASGLALRDCDIDIYLDVSNFNTSPTHTNIRNNIETHQRKAFNRINSLLHHSPNFTDVFAIRGARVPIIKCKHSDTGFSIDINVSCPSSRENTQFIYDVIKSDERIHQLMLFLKLWAKNMQIIGRYCMTSYCLITMIIFYLQQPRKLLHNQTVDSDYRILKSIRELQENCPFHMVQGVNYAYDLNNEENMPNIPATVTTWELIKEFFSFYQNFDFENSIISPFYGEPVAKADLTVEICEEYYKQLRTITQYLHGVPANFFQIDRFMCVQDAFCLNQNTAKSISFPNGQYIILCIKYAQKICENPHKLELKQLYEHLLFDTINVNPNNAKEKNIKILTDLQNINVPSIDANNTNNNVPNLEFTIQPSKVDLRAVASHYPDITSPEGILRCWCEIYIDAIATMITNLYRMDMQKQLPAQQKQQKIDKEGEGKGEELNKSWLLFCTIDLWSNRCFQKHLQTTFMSYQLKQTKRLHALRRQDPKYSVTLNGILKINILPNYMGISIQLDLAEGTSVLGLRKKDPLRKFFNIFRNTLQNFNFKENLDADKVVVKNRNETVVETEVPSVNVNES